MRHILGRDRAQRLLLPTSVEGSVLTQPPRFFDKGDRSNGLLQKASRRIRSGANRITSQHYGDKKPGIT